MKICFYDVSLAQDLAHLNGQIMTLNELYDHHLKSRKDWPQLVLNKDAFSSMDFHPYRFEGDKGRSWGAYFTTAIQLISGHQPSREEIKITQEYVRQLPNEFKRAYVTQRFIVGFLAYLLVGFKAHTGSVFISESNAINTLVEFTKSLFNSKKVLFTSFLCSHRDPKVGVELNLLQSCIPAEKIRRVGALTLAIMRNASEHIRGGSIFLQQSVTPYATSSIFPEVTVRYLEEGRTYEMLDRLDYQFSLVKGVFKELSNQYVHTTLVTLDVLTIRIEKFLKMRFGEGWRRIDFTSSTYEHDSIVQIAVDMALPGIKRMMPFFSGDFQQKFIARKNEIVERNCAIAREVRGGNSDVLIKKVIEWFMLQHSMTISAKAVYETVFYYLWGSYCGRSKAVFAIGFDREHDQFQHFAWELGVEEQVRGSIEKQNQVLYTRRNPNGRVYGALSDLSFRQFWRYDNECEKQ